MTAKLGIVAGGGELPRRLIEACRGERREFFVLAFHDQTDPETVAGVPHAWCRLAAGGKALSLLRAHGVGELVFAGRIRRPSLAALRPDARAARFFARVGYRTLGDDGLLSAIVKEVEAEGFRVVGADELLRVAMPEGALGRVEPDAEAAADIAHGLRIARALGALDIGQAVVVQQGLVLGVEAIEGTDALLARCASLRREGPGGVLVKCVKPGQSRLADLPTVGPETVRAAAAAGLRGLAFEANGTILLDRAAVIAAAKEAGLFLLAFDPASIEETKP